MAENFRIDAARGYVRAGGTRISYLDWGGDGRPALLLHGITSSAATQWRVAAAMRGAGYRPVALDMPGHGESDVSADHAIDTVAGLAGAAIEALGLRDLLLVGHSWGGATALALAGGEHPARAALTRVVLLDPVLAMSAERGRERLPGYLEGLGEPAEQGAAQVRATNPEWLDEDVHWKAVALEQCRSEQVEGFFLPREKWSLVPRAGRVAAPLLVLVADPAYTFIPPGLLDELRAAVAPGRGAIRHVPGTNHNMLRGPGFEPTMAALREWLGL